MPSYRRDGWLLALATGVVGVTFGVLAAAGGLTLLQSSAMSAFVFTGASQFAAVTVIAGGGSVLTAVAGGLLLGARNALYGPSVSGLLATRKVRRAVAAQFVIDETTAMATAQEDRTSARKAFWWTALWLWSFWNLGTVVGFLVGGVIGDPQAWGLDAAFPAAFIALIVPHLRTRGGQIAAGVGAVVATLMIPVLPAGVPIIAAGVGVVPGYLAGRRTQP